MTVLHLVVYYGVAIGIWGLALKKSFLWFILVGVIIGLLLGLIADPVVSKQRTNERSREMMFAVGTIWGNIAIVISILGFVVWIIRAISFH